MASMQAVKIVVVGDSLVGKTSLLLRLTTGECPREPPTKYDTYTRISRLEDEAKLLVTMWDVACEDDYDRLRQYAYDKTDLGLVLFSVASPASFERVTTKWVPELRRCCKDVPFLLVGTKVELREDEELLLTLRSRRLRPVSEADGKAAAERLGAIGYAECSALLGDGVDLLFQAIVDGAVAGIEEKRRRLRENSDGRCLFM
eukprot:PLAT4827.1.p1 GENE.PLAT4827.1~~PLAT4827.1.p1  ORF type:complete len:216 (+),score=90.85 PLAT4827.1:45-650(+)